MEAFQQTIGEDPMIDQRYQLWKGTPEEVISGADYLTFDSTLQSEKGFVAQSWQELLVAVISNPESAQMLDLDPRSMVEEIQYLRGVGHIGRFSLSKRVASGAAPPLPPQVVPGGGPPQAGAVPPAAAA